MQANTIYSGLYLTKGTHTIKLIYSTPGFKIGAVITLLSLLGGVLAIIFVNRKKHHQVEKE
jgi:uncharacterized membrane protein YfhO